MDEQMQPELADLALEAHAATATEADLGDAGRDGDHDGIFVDIGVGAH